MISEVTDSYINKLKNRLFGLLCEFEKDGAWIPYLDSILIELEGVPEERRTINFISLYQKISSLRYLRYEYFRKTIFDCMNLLSKGEFNELFGQIQVKTES